MNNQDLQKARASLLVLIRNNIENIAERLSKDPKALEKVIQEYERNGGDKHDIAKAISIGLSRVYTAGADGTTIFYHGDGDRAETDTSKNEKGTGGKKLDINAISNLINSVAGLGNVFCGFFEKCRNKLGQTSEPQKQGDNTPPPTFFSPPPPPQQGGSKLPLILGIAFGAIALIIVAIILTRRKKAAV